MSRLYRKNFDKVLDKCWVSIPRGDFGEERHRTINGMEHPDIRNDLWNLYRYLVSGKCDATFKRWLNLVNERGRSSVLENVLWNDLFYFYASKAEYEWWVGDKKVNWYDPYDEDVWEQVLEGCKPLFELFEEAINERY